MSTLVEWFEGEFAFLSNFAPAVVTYGDASYPTVEHAYQAAKTTNLQFRRAFQTDSKLNWTPGRAKRMGRELPLDAGWEARKMSVMLYLLRQKFAHGELKELLEQTGDAELVEGNEWNDTFWGVCRGVGENQLGKLLMQVRAENRA